MTSWLEKGFHRIAVRQFGESPKKFDVLVKDFKAVWTFFLPVRTVSALVSC